MPLSTKQMEYLALAWQCFDTEPKIDYEKFKTVAGLKSAASARELMRVTKNKLKEEYGALSGKTVESNIGTATPKKNATVANGKAATPASKRQHPARAKPTKGAAASVGKGVDDGEDDEGEETTQSPSKKAKTGTAVIKAEPDGGMEEEEDFSGWSF